MVNPTLGGGTGIPIPEFCALVELVTKKFGQDVMISVCDKEGHMHLTKKYVGLKPGTLVDKHLGYIDIHTGSLVWDKKL
jgi:hypothetical protein